MIPKATLLKSLFIFTNYGDGERSAYSEMLLLFYLFYQPVIKSKAAQKLFPKRNPRSFRRYISNLEARGFITEELVETEPGQIGSVLVITDKGTAYCLEWMNRAEEFVSGMKKA